MGLRRSNARRPARRRGGAVSLLWTGRDRDPEPQPDDLDDVFDFMAYVGAAALAITLLAMF